jgi:WhiB family transcriptional regulator, redox-sensing transcriptional regulator
MSDIHRHLPGRPDRNSSADWRDEAACRGIDPELFFPVGHAGPALRQIGQAKQLCAGCPVRMPCLEWALDSGQEAGVWGGTSEDERRVLRSRRMDRPAPIPVPRVLAAHDDPSQQRDTARDARTW